MDKETIMQLLSDGVISNEVAAKYFPELKESEDERIRKCVKYAIDKLFLKEKIVCDVRKDDVLAWLEKQGEQNLTDVRTIGYWHVEDVEQKSANKVEPKIKVKYAGCEYNVLEVKDIAGVTYYGIEDEPNHIDYVKADNCKIISGGYGIKENGSPYPTKTAVFSEQKPAWSEEDEINYNYALAACIYYGESKGYTDTETHQKTNNWLKSLKERYTWKPSDEQLKALEGCVDYLNESDNEDLLVMESLLEQLKAL